MILNRKGREVYFGDKKLVINAQATKGPGNEVVKIEGLEGANGQKWLALSRLVEGENDIECKGHEVTSGGTRGKNYELTEEQAKEVKELRDRIDAIIEEAKKNYVPKPKLDVDPTKMTLEERQAKMEELTKYLTKYYGV